MSGYHFNHHFDWRFYDRNLIITPLFHISGHMFTITNLHRGSTSVYADFHPNLTWDVIEQEQITGTNPDCVCSQTPNSDLNKEKIIEYCRGRLAALSVAIELNLLISFHALLLEKYIKPN